MTLTHIAIDAIEFGKIPWWRRIIRFLLRRRSKYLIPWIHFCSPKGEHTEPMNIDRAFMLRPQPIELPSLVDASWKIKLVNPNDFPITVSMRLWGDFHYKYQEITEKGIRR